MSEEAPKTPIPFVHLHVHTTYSLLDGACQIKPLVKRVKELGMDACAITDHGNLYGLKSFYDTCKKEGIKPILGCEAYTTNEDYKKRIREERRNHLILIAKNLTGYYNLVKLISYAHLEGKYYHPRIDKELLVKYHEGLICTSACIAGEVQQFFDEDRDEEAEKSARWFQNLFGDDYYLEIMLHTPKPGVPLTPEKKIGRNGEPIPPINVRQARIIPKVIALGKKLGIKVIATNDVHFLRESDAEAHDALLCLGQGKDITDENRLRYTREEWLKSYDEMSANLPNNLNEIHNTRLVADKVEVYKLDVDNPILPVFPIPETFGKEEDYQREYTEEKLREEFGDRFDKLVQQGLDKVVRIKFESDYLRYLTFEGAKKRFPEGVPPDVTERLDFELDTIKKMGFPGYFLIVRDYIVAAREMGVSVGPGRGSAAGSMVAYCLTITNVDPMKYDLLFERFLNPDRISMPDIDVDFDDDGRGRVLEYVTQKYGQEHVGHIVTFGQMAPKMAIKDVCRVFKIPLSESIRLASYVPNEPKINFDKALEKSPDLKNEYDNTTDPTIKKALTLARTLDGTLRQPGIHACGIIISRDPLIETLPIMPTVGESLLTTQYDGHFVEPIGLLKMDFLGLKTLTVIKECLENIKEDYKIDIDIDNVSLTDKETYELLARGETTGLFQFESAGMKKYLRELKPTCLEDLVAMNALYRPGPMQYIPQFINRKHGLEPITYDHPLMEKYLNTTYGVTVYQEQVMLLSRLLGGFTRGQSDTLRKAMGKKNLALMEELYIKFENGCLANPEFTKGKTTIKLGEVGHEHEETLDLTKPDEARKVIGKIWADWKAFASYAFNKSHAVCYAYLAYQTGYLKAHYKAEFMCAQIDSEYGKFDKLPGLVAEAKDIGLSVLKPDINFSLSRFTPAENAIRFGLGGIKGVGTQAAQSIVDERIKGGLYKSFTNFIERINTTAVNARALEALIKVGAFDTIEPNRARLLGGLPFVMQRAAQKQSDKASGQANFFDILGGGGGAHNSCFDSDTDIPPAIPWDDKERLGYEKELLGIWISGNPIDSYRTIISDIESEKISSVLEYTGGESGTERKHVRIVGLPTISKRMMKDGRQWATVLIEGETGKIECPIFPKTYSVEANKQALTITEIDKDGKEIEKPYDDPLVIIGELQYKDNTQSLIVNELHKLSDAMRIFAEEITFIIPKEPQERQLRAIQALKAIVKEHPGNIPTSLKICFENGDSATIEFGNEYYVTPSTELLLKCNKFLGKNTMRIKTQKEKLYHTFKQHRYFPKKDEEEPKK